MSFESGRYNASREPGLKLVLDAGFSCPGRCSFCDNAAFHPAYSTRSKSISRQLDEGIAFHAARGRTEGPYLAYFQSYSNTYAPLDVLRQRYEEALSVEDVVGLVIGTRPDCIKDDILQYLASLQDEGYLITLELGIESFYDKTLLRINRGHTVEDSLNAIHRCADANINTTIHLILGLPGETKANILVETDIINHLPIQSIKLHQLQILKGTVIAQEYARHPEDFLSMNIDEYATLVAEFISRLRKDIHIERFASSAPSDLIIAPRWGLKPSEVQKRIEEKLIPFDRNY